MPRYLHGILVLIVMIGAACRKPEEPLITAVDLIRQLDRADKRPPEPFHVADHRVDDVSRPSIMAPVPSRMTWPLALPRRGVFHAFVALADVPPATLAAPIRLRVGISDHRIYEGLTDVTIVPGARRWTELRADLSAYAGWKFSLFYRPDRVSWRLVLAADAIAGVPAVAVWGSPEIVTDTAAAREYRASRH